MPANKLPVFGGIGNREIIGYAISLRSATALIRSKLSIDSRMTLQVWRRSAVLMDILDAPDGYVYSISYKY